ncbi:LemA family protein [Candidatus Woesearchaeota archaeon]|nr:LemA family protein [Candidatus Woesearchaeota archaeon]|tara:strand:- start:7988 stop:8593 length:606 start_codon:yes stop_codon:yes gene_type:complete
MAKSRKNLYIIGGIAGFVLLLVLIFFGSYNSLITLSESVDAGWAQVENQYQRRADLIPNLISTVQGAADFESETQEQITALRTQAVAARDSWNSATTPADQIVAARQVDSVASAFRGLNINVENYPQLKATQNFETFQAQLEGTENRVATERKRYNDAVRAYNIKIKRIPTVFIANMFGFTSETYFDIEEGTEQVPVVEFE